MAELLSQLGIDGKLLLSQGVNFGIVLAVLTYFIYRPLVKILNERKTKIEFGLKGAAEAERRLAEIEKIKIEKIAEGERQAFAIVKTAEDRAGTRGEEIVGDAEAKSADLLKKAGLVEEQRRIEALAKLAQESRNIIKTALIKMVSLKPQAIDEALLEEAEKEIKGYKI